MNKLLIVDGHNLLFQMFFGMPNKIYNQDNKQIQGTLGFVGALLKIIRKIDPSHILVVFDGETTNERFEIDSNYKSNRIDYTDIPEEDNPFSQLNDIYSALDYLKIPHFEAIDCEADDIIADYALKYSDKYEIYISSYDSDFFQLISKNVKILRYRGDNTKLCGIEYLIERYNISPKYYADFKSLVGDNSDNIKGVPLIGVKTAAKLINLYGGINGIIDNLQNIYSDRIKISLETHVDRMKLNYSLIKLKSRKYDFILSTDELKYTFDDSITTNFVLTEIGVK